MRRLILSGLAFVAVGMSLSACVVEAPGPGPGCYWVPGHYKPDGYYVPKHVQCP